MLTNKNELQKPMIIFNKPFLNSSLALIPNNRRQTSMLPLRAVHSSYSTNHPQALSMTSSLLPLKHPLPLSSRDSHTASQPRLQSSPSKASISMFPVPESPKAITKIQQRYLPVNDSLAVYKRPSKIKAYQS